jgi:carboxyl-terminal processing protease
MSLAVSKIRVQFAKAASLVVALTLTPTVPERAFGAQARTDQGILAEATFDFVWSRVRDTYYDSEMNGLDWDAVRAELRPRAVAAPSVQDLRAVLAEMLSRLGESHFTIIPGSAASAFGFEDAGAPNGTAEPGFEVRWLEGAVVVTGVRTNGPAHRAGVRAGWILEAIGDVTLDTLAGRIRQSAREGMEERQLGLFLPGSVQRWIRGPEGSVVRLRFRRGDSVAVSIDVPRERPVGEEVRFGNLPPVRVDVTFRTEVLDGRLDVAILRWSAWFPGIVPSIAEAMDSARDADGLVVDLRGNPGGLGALAMGIGGHFLNDAVSLGTMRTRDTELRFTVNPQRVAPDGRRVEPYTGPLAILVDPLTASTSEFFAGGMQTLGRARVFGELTAGQALPAVVVDLPNGDRLMHAVADFTGPDGSRLEGSGVRPDVLAPPSRESLLAGEDAALNAAFAWLEETPR